MWLLYFPGNALMMWQSYVLWLVQKPSAIQAPSEKLWNASFLYQQSTFQKESKPNLERVPSPKRVSSFPF